MSEKDIFDLYETNCAEFGDPGKDLFEEAMDIAALFIPEDDCKYFAALLLDAMATAEYNGFEAGVKLAWKEDAA